MKTSIDLPENLLLKVKHLDDILEVGYGKWEGCDADRLRERVKGREQKKEDVDLYRKKFARIDLGTFNQSTAFHYANHD
jgi:hypothetical protein